MRFCFSRSGMENREKFPNLSSGDAAMQATKGSKIIMLKAASFCKILGASETPSLERMRHPLSLILFRTDSSFSQLWDSWETSTEDGMARWQHPGSCNQRCYGITPCAASTEHFNFHPLALWGHGQRSNIWMAGQWKKLRLFDCSPVWIFYALWDSMLYANVIKYL